MVGITLTGTTGADTYNGTEDLDALFGIDGNDSLDGKGSADFLVGGLGNDTISGGDGDDWIAIGDGIDSISGGNGWDTGSFYELTRAISLIYDPLNTTATDSRYTNLEQFHGTIYNDVFFLVHASDYGLEYVEAHKGNDYINVNWSTNVTLSGGEGDDTVASFYNFNGTVIGGAGNDILTTFSSEGYGVINGDEGNDNIASGFQYDTINGGTGVDTLWYDYSNTGVAVDLYNGFGYYGTAEGDIYAGIEAVVGSQYGDIIWGTNGNDTFLTGGGNDHVRADGGADYIDGGEGYDTAWYYTSNAAITINLATGQTTGGDAAGDVLQSIEWLVGSAYGDSLTGNTEANYFDGYAGNDTMNGQTGNDTMTGGLGNDAFLFTDTNSGTDFITDFTSGQDKIQVTGATFGSMNNTTLTVVNNANPTFSTIAQSFFWFETDTSTLWYLPNSASVGQATQIATLYGVTSLSKTDFEII